MAKLTITDHLRNLTIDKIDFDPRNDEQSSYTPYIVNRFISSSELFVLFVNEINRYNIPKHAHYRYMLSFLPKRKLYFSYIKGKKKEYSQQEIDTLCEYFEIGKKQLHDYLEFLTEENVEQIFKKYGGSR